MMGVANPAPSQFLTHKYHIQMATSLTRGRAIQNKDNVGGLKAVYFVDFGDLGSATRGSEDEITAFDGTFSAHKYELKGANSFEQPINTSRENGTTFYEQTLSIVLPALSKEDHKELKLIIIDRKQVVIETNNGEFFVVGLENGADVTGGTVSTGAAMGDLTGYSLTITAQEKDIAPFVEGFTSNAGITVVG